MYESPIAASAGSASRNARSISIAGRPFDLTLWDEPERGAWHWTITAPGVLALSGDAASKLQALDAACRAGRTLARLSAPAALGSLLP
jgi:hypothetical protein